MLHIKFPIFQRGALFCMATTLFLGGCAVNVNPPSASLTPPPTTRESVLINYSDGQIQSKLVELDLLKPFNDYWSAHAARDWARLHAFEVADGVGAGDHGEPVGARRDRPRRQSDPAGALRRRARNPGCGTASRTRRPLRGGPAAPRPAPRR